MSGYDGIDTGSVLANRGLNGFYGYGGHGNFSGDGSAVNANVVANRDASIIDSINTSSANQFLSDRITSGDAAIQANITQSNQFLSDRIWSQSIDSKFAAVTADFASMERLAFAQQAETQRQLHAMDLKQTECCCELKAGQASILAKLDADRAESLAAENNRLTMQIAISNGRGNAGNG